MLGPLLPLLALLGMAVAAASPRLRPALLPGLATVALLGASAALDGPVARYRYPADPLIALTAMGGLVWAASLVASLVARCRSSPDARAAELSLQNAE